MFRVAGCGSAVPRVPTDGSVLQPVVAKHELCTMGDVTEEKAVWEPGI